MEIFAWILLFLGAIASLLALALIGFLFIFLFGMSFDAPGSSSDPMAWLMRIVVALLAIVAVSIIPYFVYYAYVDMRAGNHSGAIFSMSIILSPLLIAALVYAIRSIIVKKSLDKVRKEYAANMKKEEEAKEAQRVREAQEAEKAKASVRIAKSAEKGAFTLSIENGYEYQNVKVFVYVQRVDGKNAIFKMSEDTIERKRFYTDWKKEIALLTQNEPQSLDFNNLPDNEESQTYWVEIQSERNDLLSFLFRKIEGNIES